MTDLQTQSEKDFIEGCNKIQALRQEIVKSIIGQNKVVDEMIIGLLAGGHTLIEGVPGLGKTLLVRTMAKAAGSEFRRIQFTPDLMPSDITGHTMFDTKNNQFRIRRGPIFCNFLLADEINRAPAKTQAALLESMQELQVTIEGKSLILEPPFLVMATQNPIEQEGTYPLPQAQTDRFLFKIFISYPTADDELQIVTGTTDKQTGDGLNTSMIQPVLATEDVLKLQQLAANMTIDKEVASYVVRIVRTTRSWNGIDYGAGPRGGINLLRAARGNALLNSRNYVIPDDVKGVAMPVLRHRIKLSADLEIEGYSPDDVIAELLENVEAPRL
ncbi:MoxR family ATPase [Desulfopila sp. IMCC35008]|uniref:AAA family ATPase n=1 Tax=Desulfopila sp. IMCC35008 TaxID=2653858 RepID=UPI0013D1D471|nr:MoxR family ATPase [Desulfopila sp. IMCC35008]